jgi:glyoxylase-like metal-dependent hydrolase (beta-lactamase superfamily II)
MRSPPTHLVALVALVLLALVAGCGTRHAVARVGALTVHTFTRDQAHAYVIAQGRSLVMVDSGYERNAASLDAAMRDERLDPADHAGGARYFQQRYGARVIAGRGDLPMLATGRNEPICPTGLIARIRRSGDEGAPGTSAPWRATPWSTSSSRRSAYEAAAAPSARPSGST